jgi:carboxypeptidase C (cathepsin A)
MFGMFKENGPFLLDVNKKDGKIKVNLVRNIHSWHKVASMLYIDNPVGTGFSFTRDPAGYPTNDSEVADHLVVALTQFMKLLPYYIPGY